MSHKHWLFLSLSWSEFSPPFLPDGLHLELLREWVEELVDGALPFRSRNTAKLGGCILPIIWVPS